MRKVLVPVLVVLGLLVALVLVVGAVSPSTEVVVLTTVDAEGDSHSTPLWVVDLDGAQWLRGDPRSGWVTRLEANPEVDLERDDRVASYRAMPAPDAEARDRVNDAMATKYGASDSLVMLWASPAESLPIRLDPR